MAHDLRKKLRTRDVLILENADFSSMLLCDRVLSGLAKAGFKKPSPIQLEAIPTGRFGKDLWVQAKSGTGKTLVFVIVALEMLHHRLFRPQVLILVPTREIATQICSVVKIVGSSFHKLRCESFIGGLSVANDIKKANHCQIAVGTPGRIKQLINLKALSTNSIRLVVFDEADELLAYSWQDDIDGIFNSLPEDKQVIATSATYPPKLKKVMFKYLRDPYIARLDSKKLALLGIIHYAKIVESSAMPLKQYDLRLAALEPILKTLKFTQCLVYCNGIHKVETLYRDIKKWGFSTTYICSSRDQSERLKAIESLKRFKCKVLVSSDVTARGIDAENVDLVVNFDISNCIETYLHRSGRAGRYGSVGVTISIVDKFELKHLKMIEKQACFKSYILPEPLPADIIQNPSLEKYVIEISDYDTETEENEEEKSISFTKKPANVFLRWKHEAKKAVDEIESKCSLSTIHSNINSEKLNIFLEPASIEMNNPMNGTCENKQLSLNKKSMEHIHNNSDCSMNDSFKNLSICEDITKNSKSLEVKSDSPCKSKASVQGSHDFSSVESGAEVGSITHCHGDMTSNVLNKCKELDVSIPLPLENPLPLPLECTVNTNKQICDINSKVSAIQLDSSQNIENTFLDGSVNSLTNSENKTDLDVHSNEINQAIETFVNNYEACSNWKGPDSLTNKENSLFKNIETDIISTSIVTGLNSKKSDYCYKVFKLFLEDNVCNNSENEMQENLKENENKSDENKFCTKEKTLSGEVNDEEKLTNNQETNEKSHFVMTSDFDKLKHENLKELSDKSISENPSVPDYDIPNFCETPNDESTPYCDKTKYKVSTLFEGSDPVKPHKNSPTFFDELSEKSDSDTKSGDKTSIDTSQCSMENSESESESDSCSDNSDLSSLEDESSEEDEESFRDRESLDGSQALSLSSSSKKKFVCDKTKSPVNFQHAYPASQVSTDVRSHQPSPSRLVNTHQKHHSGHLNHFLQQPHLSRCLRTHSDISVHFPANHHPHHSLCSECKQSVPRIKHNSVCKKNLPSCSSGFEEQHSPLCFMPSEHRCHPYNDSIVCNQREICAQWYQIFYNQWLHIQRHSYFNS